MGILSKAAQDHIQGLADERAAKMVKAVAQATGLSEQSARDWMLRDQAVQQLADALVQQDERREAEHESQDAMWKRLIVEKAWEWAERFDWCDEVQLCLASMGIQLDEPELEAELVVIYKVRANVPYNELPSIHQRGEGYVREHFSFPAVCLADLGEHSLRAVQTEDGHEYLFDPSAIEVKEWRLEGPKPKA